MIFFIYFENSDVFSNVLIFVIRAFWLLSGVLTLANFTEFLKRSMVNSIFFISQPKDILNLCLNLNKSQPIYACKKKVMPVEKVIAFSVHTNHFGV